MRKILTTICALTLAALMPAAVLLSRNLPPDTRTYVETKYAGWNGVLQAWVCARWSPAGSFISWLNECAADFEKAHDGVYIEFTPVDMAAMRAMDESGIPRPDLVFFSPGIFEGEDMLSDVEIPAELRDEFLDFKSCLPVAMGGYIWVFNRSLCTSPSGLPRMILPDADGRSFSAALIPLLETGDADAALPEPGLDLGLPAISDLEPMAASEEAIDRFINGEIECTIITQRELSRLIRLRENGRGPDWDCHVSGSFAWADQLLLAGVPRQEDGRSAERMELSREFAALLTGEKAQAALADIGAFSVTRTQVHPTHSAYAELDALLSSRPLAVPQVFSEHSAQNGAAIIRAFFAGEISAREAIAKMGLKFDLQFEPN